MILQVYRKDDSLSVAGYTMEYVFNELSTVPVPFRTRAESKTDLQTRGGYIAIT
jgi:hypothetical protein